MATATSTVQAAQAAILAAISASTVITTSVPPPLVKIGPPQVGVQIPDDLIIIGEQTRQAYQPTVMRGDGGAGWLQEDYKTTLVVDVYRGGDDSTVAQSRLFTLVNAVDDAIRNDPSLNTTVILAWPSAHNYTLDWEPDAKGWIARCDMEISVVAKP
jgi:hypothetical protein